jgi:hypothetical protein
MDPRVSTPAEGLARQFVRAMNVVRAIGRVRGGLDGVRALRKTLGERRGRVPKAAAAELPAALEKRAAALEGDDDAPASEASNLKQLVSDLAALYEILQGADAAPTAQALAAADALAHAVDEALARWSRLEQDATALR